MSKFSDRVTEGLNRFFRFGTPPDQTPSREASDKGAAPINLGKEEPAVIQQRASGAQREQAGVLQQKSSGAVPNYFPRNVSSKELSARPSTSQPVKISPEAQQRIDAKRQFDLERIRQQGERRYQQYNNQYGFTERRNSNSSSNSAPAPINSAPEVQRRPVINTPVQQNKPVVNNPIQQPRPVVNTPVQQRASVAVQQPRPASLQQQAHVQQPKPASLQQQAHVQQPRPASVQQQVPVQQPRHPVNAFHQQLPSTGIQKTMYTTSKSASYPVNNVNAAPEKSYPLQGPKADSAASGSSARSKTGPELPPPPKPVDLTKQPTRSSLAGSRGLWPAGRVHFDNPVSDNRQSPSENDDPRPTVQGPSTRR